jgi:lipid-A-disaccharide synthase
MEVYERICYSPNSSSVKDIHKFTVTRRILISCGEASGDFYASALVEELRKLDPEVSCFGIGGDQLAGAGAELLVTLDEISVIGLVEVIEKLPALLRARGTLEEAARQRRPDVAVLIDFSGFNLRLGRSLKALGIPIVYYVSPQVWAWRRGRVKVIREIVDKMLVILPFEEDFYRREGIPVRFVGHPLVDVVKPREDRSRFFETVGLHPDRPVVAVLPGSRKREIELHLPILIKAMKMMLVERAELQFLVLEAPTIRREEIQSRLGGLTEQIPVISDSTYEGLAHATAAIVASGTATVEAALCGTPMVVVYRTSKLSYMLGKPFVQVPHYAMVNLIAKRRLVPEIIQDDLTDKAVVQETLHLLEDTSAADAMRQGLEDVKARLGEGGASHRAAQEVIAIASQRRI